MPVIIHTYPCLSDNYGYLLHDQATGATAAIDAPDKNAMLEALELRGWNLTDIFVTHHHFDHTDAIVPLKKQFDIKVSGPAAEADKIAGLDVKLSDNDTVELGQTQLKVIATPGHTLGHICFFDSDNKNLFSGDALFSLGCGRMFEGTPGPMWDGLKRLRELPDETLVHCGHEYSAANAAFALSIDPRNNALTTRAQNITLLRRNHQATVPFVLGEDKRANPFLRADKPDIAQAMHLMGAAPQTIFAAVRKAKDDF